ncbi:MAG: RluA family pseudouridine synthase [Kiritimatiellia bacterium]
MAARSSIPRQPSRPDPKAARSPVDMLFEDADVLVVDKPAGMIVHPAPGHETGTLVDALLACRPQLAGVGSVARPGIVHRLDQDTSGVMVVAKTARAYAALRKAFERHAGVEKTYLAVVHGTPKPRSGTLETLIGRKPWDAKRMAVVEANGQRAVTHWEVLQTQGAISLVEFRIETGRTHQIRVHAAHLGHPIVGDPLYGNAGGDRSLPFRPSRTLLHAVGLAFPHPATGRRVEFFAVPPADIVHARA